MLRHAIKKSAGTGADYCQANAAQLPFRSGAFDLLTCLNFLHLFPTKEDKESFILEAARVLRPGGTGIFEFDNALHGLLVDRFASISSVTSATTGRGQCAAVSPRHRSTT